MFFKLNDKYQIEGGNLVFIINNDTRFYKEMQVKNTDKNLYEETLKI